MEITDGVRVRIGNFSIDIFENETEILITTDNTEFDESYAGIPTFVSKDEIHINGEAIGWEYIVDVGYL